MLSPLSELHSFFVAVTGKIILQACVFAMGLFFFVFSMSVMFIFEKWDCARGVCQIEFYSHSRLHGLECPFLKEESICLCSALQYFTDVYTAPPCIPSLSGGIHFSDCDLCFVCVLVCVIVYAIL